jgi:periplasmic protein TonB
VNKGQVEIKVEVEKTERLEVGGGRAMKQMKQGKKKSSSQAAITTGVVLLVFLFLAGGLIYLLKTDKGGGGKKVFVANVDLVKPSLDRPPPPPKEKLPEPELQKKETIVAPQDMAQPQQSSAKGDDKPSAEGPLGLDAQGGAGSDGFGLAGRKGGRDVTTLGTGGGKIGGGGDPAALLRQFAPYTRLVEEDVNRLVRKRLEENGGIPKGKLETTAEIVVSNKGAVREYRIIRSSGNRSMDDAVKESLKYAKISQPLPEGCPKTMSIRISSQG